MAKTITNDFLIIDSENRSITVPETESFFGVFADRNVERKYFKCPKIVGDNVDLSACEIFINYVSVGNTPGQYQCTDVEVLGDEISFSWLLSGNVFDTNKTGNIFFAMQAKNLTGMNVFNTKKAMGQVSETVKPVDYTEEKYADVVLDLIARVGSLEKNGLELKVASEYTLGGVKAKRRTTESVPVVADEDGMLWVGSQSGGGGDTSSNAGLTDWQKKKETEFSVYSGNTLEIVPGVFFERNVVEIFIEGKIRPNGSEQGFRMTFYDTSQKDWLGNSVNNKVDIEADWQSSDSSHIENFRVHLQKVMHHFMVVSFYSLHGRNIKISSLDSSDDNHPFNFINKILIDNVTANDIALTIYTKSKF